MIGRTVQILLVSVFGVVLGAPNLYNYRQTGQQNAHVNLTDINFIIIPTKELLDVGISVLPRNLLGRNEPASGLMQKLAGFARASIAPYAVDIDNAKPADKPTPMDLNQNNEELVVPENVPSEQVAASPVTEMVLTPQAVEKVDEMAKDKKKEEKKDEEKKKVEGEKKEVEGQKKEEEKKKVEGEKKEEVKKRPTKMLEDFVTLIKN